MSSETKKTVNKLILRESEVRGKVASAIDKITLPVIETIGPMGKNVLIQNEVGAFELTNDGVTIARSVNVDDEVESSIISVIKDAASRTNQEAGDGTSTTILFVRTILNKVFEMKKKGFSQRQIRSVLSNVSEKILKQLSKLKHDVKDDETLRMVAKISANNDSEIASYVVDTIKTTGVDGLVVIELNNNEDTVLEKQPGFRIPSGMLYQNLYSDATRPQAYYKDIPVIIFDKKLYYAEECEHILRVAKDLGYSDIVVVARDFLGDAPNTFIANHVHGVIKLVLAKIDDETQLEDLAVYIGGSVVSEAGGRRVDSISINDFRKVESVFADPQKILVKTADESPLLKSRVNALKDELKKDKENKALKNRISSLTNGVVTIKVGGRTATEMREKVYRYEDAINAVRSAKQYGYLVGGGLSLYNCYNKKDYNTREENELALAITRASIEQIAENSMVDIEYDKLTKSIGFDASVAEYVDLMKAGVVEPYKVTEMAIKNSISAADVITSIGTYIVNDYGREDDE